MKTTNMQITVQETRSIYFQSVMVSQSVEVELEDNENPAQARQAMREKLAGECGATAQSALDRIVESLTDEQKATLTNKNGGGSAPARGAGGTGGNGRTPWPPNAKEDQCNKCGAPVMFAMISKGGKTVPEKWDEDGTLHYKTCTARNGGW